MGSYLHSRKLLAVHRLFPMLFLLGRASLATAQEAPSPAENRPSVVEAQDQEPAEIQAESGNSWATALIADGAFGFGPQHRNGLGFALDGALRLRLSSFEFGVVVGKWTASAYDANNQYYGLLAGYRHSLQDNFGLELLAEGGRHDEEISGGPTGLGGHGWVVLPYAGLRAGIDARIGGRLRFVIGLWCVLRVDLKTEHVVVDGHDLGTAGGLSGAIQLRFGFEPGLGK